MRPYRLACMSCQWQSVTDRATICPQCGQTIDLIFADNDIVTNENLPGIWRFASRLPLADSGHIVSLGEGNTPLLLAANLGRDSGIARLFFKLEGSNPTGSYKDRIATVGISRLLEQRKGAWAATSSGNAGASLAAYGARAELAGYLFTLEQASVAKLAQIMSYGPQVRAIRRLGLDPEVDESTWRNIRQLCLDHDWMMLVTARAYSPQAMEGVKTLAYEIGEQLADDPPDVVYVPVGGGGLLSMVWKGFVEWQAARKIDRLPRLVAVQALGCDPVTQAWQAKRPLQTISNCQSTISGIQLTAPPDGTLVLQALQESDGWALSVPDAETYQAQAELTTREGIFVEPAAAITWAGVKADRRNGRLQGDEKVVCILTGIGFKDMNAVTLMNEGTAIPLIEAAEILSLNA